jgi:hypothetical protein
VQSFTVNIARKEHTIESLLHLYKRWISPLFAHSCRFNPTCSEYAAQAVMELGWYRGILLSARRLLRCHPFGASGYDPVPGPSHGEQLRP